MNNEAKKTLVFLLTALVLAGSAAWSRRPVSAVNAIPAQGKEFFPDFNDPNSAGSLEVVEYDSKAAKVDRFQVARDNQFWKIPTHFNYPADAETRLAKTAGAVIGLIQDQYITDSAANYADLGVLNPEESGETTQEDARGKLIRIKKSADGELLAQYIIGKPVANREGYHYVRVPDKKQVYAVKVNADISTKFADWIETNLLKVDTGKIRQIQFINNRFDFTKLRESRGDRYQAVVNGGVTTLKRGSDFGPWSIDGPPLQPDQEIDSSKTSSLISALGDVKIVGVRMKDEALATALKQAEAEKRPLTPILNADREWVSRLDPRIAELSQGSQRVLDEGNAAGREPTGFFVCFARPQAATADREPEPSISILPSQTAIEVGAEDGTVYTLFFGETLLAQGDELTSGKKAEGDAKKAEAAAKKDDAKKAEGEATPETKEENRFLFVTVHFDPSLVPPPAPQPIAGPTEEDLVFEDPFQGDYLKDHPKREERKTAEEAAKKRTEEDLKAHQTKLADQKKKVNELKERFASWYYVTRGDSFKSIALHRPELIKVKDKPGDNAGPGGAPGGFGGAPGGFGGAPGGFGLPPGHPAP